MPITVKCSCGKSLSVKDQFAGKAIKCPQCQQVIRVPSGAAGGPAAPFAPAGRSLAPPSVGGDSGMDSLFDEAGFTVRSGKFCPECAAPLQPDAVLCTKCGFHLESGNKFQAHRVQYEDADSAEAVLRKADADMKRAKALDEKLQSAGMPAWMLALILFVLGSITMVAVVAINISRQTSENNVSFNATATMLSLGGIGFNMVAIGAFCVILYRAFQDDAKQGAFVLLIPFYVFYYAYKNPSGIVKPLLVNLITGVIAGVLFFLSSLSVQGKL